jgi:alpha/beta superfamily hydrolase
MIRVPRPVEPRACRRAASVPGIHPNHLFVLSLVMATGGLATEAITKPASSRQARSAKPRFTLPAQKKGFKTAFATRNENRSPPPKPPVGVFELIKYAAPLGRNYAYVTPAKSGPKRPAIVWIQGGFYFGLDESAWQPARRDNDQSAAAFREAGIILMLPSLRGTHDNPGKRECFLGEIEDILAAAKYLAARPDVDPRRIYLGGHSTGGTMALLAAASTDFFRSIFSLGPVLNVLRYGEHSCIPRHASAQEVMLRTPARFLKEVKTPTFIIEGSRGNGPYDLSRKLIGRAPISATIVPGTDHFTVIRPASEVIVAAIRADRGKRPSIALSARAIIARIK